MTIGIAVVCLGAGYILWKVPEWQVGMWGLQLNTKDLLELQNSYRATLAQILGGLLLLATLGLTWKSIVVNQQTALHGQHTELFTHAIDQLGSEKAAVRLGGIYALGRTAVISKEHHQPVMEVVSAFVRQNAIWRGRGDEYSVPTPTHEVQAALTVIGRRRKKFDIADAPIDLSKTDLRGALLESVNLEKVNLVGCHLEGSNLRGASLRKTDLSSAVLGSVKVRRKNLTGAEVAELMEKDGSSTRRTSAMRMKKLMNYRFAWTRRILKARS